MNLGYTTYLFYFNIIEGTQFYSTHLIHKVVVDGPREGLKYELRDVHCQYKPVS